MATKHPTINFPCTPEVLDDINRALKQARKKRPTTSRSEVIRKLIRAGAVTLGGAK